MASSTRNIHSCMMLGKAAAKSKRAVIARREARRGSRGASMVETLRRAMQMKALILEQVSMSTGFCRSCLPGTKPFWELWVVSLVRGEMQAIVVLQLALLSVHFKVSDLVSLGARWRGKGGGSREVEGFFLGKIQTPRLWLGEEGPH